MLVPIWIGPCRALGCGRPIAAKGMCHMHYKRVRKHGSMEKRVLAKPLNERFWKFVDRRGDEECWLWLGAKDPKGYGKVSEWSKRRSYSAHRVSYELLIGPIPDGLCACHTCDTPSCVNPHHIFLGTLQDNNADMRAKGRQRGVPGEKHRKAKITSTQVVEIRTSTLPRKVLMQKYNLAYSTIDSIKSRRSWKHIP